MAEEKLFLSIMDVLWKDFIYLHLLFGSVNTEPIKTLSIQKNV